MTICKKFIRVRGRGEVKAYFLRHNFDGVELIMDEMNSLLTAKYVKAEVDEALNHMKPLKVGLYMVWYGLFWGVFLHRTYRSGFPSFLTAPP